MQTEEQGERTFDKYSLLHQHKAQTFVRPKSNPIDYTYQKIDHMEFWTNNALHAANFYISNFGFRLKSFQNSYSHNNTELNKYLVVNNDVRILLVSPNKPNNKKFDAFLTKHGDTLRAVTVQVDNIENCKRRIQEKKFEIVEEENDDVKQSISILVFGSTVYKFFQLKGQDYFDDFTEYENQPDFSISQINNFCPVPSYMKIDHIGFPQNEGERDLIMAKFYDLGFHDFWAVDENIIYSENSTLKSTVITDYYENIKFPIFEPKKKKVKSQIQEFLENNGGPGAQHIAIQVDNIVEVVEMLRTRGIQFLSFPETYYDLVQDKMEQHQVHMKIDIDAMKRNKILIDFDQNGFLLQIFTKPILDRPTLFVEFIQRFNNNGFGEGNFQRLFMCIEEEQKKRGNFVQQIYLSYFNNQITLLLF